MTAEPAERDDWSRTHRDMIARETRATSFESGDRADRAMSAGDDH